MWIAAVRPLGGPEVREEPRCLYRIIAPNLAEGPFRIPLLGDGEPHVHPHQNRKHRQRQKRRPLQQESEHHQDKAVVLRMANPRVRSTACQRVLTLSLIKDAPGVCQQPKAGADGDQARHVQCAEMRIALLAGQRPPELKLRQSRGVEGLEKLKANPTNTTVLMSTNPQRPYAGALSWFMAASCLEYDAIQVPQVSGHDVPGSRVHGA